ncbi:MAG: Crp/Fnr family transcriptional regulator [Pseudomonadota bacterium]
MSDEPKIQNLIATSPLFSGLDEAGCALVASYVRRASFKSGQTIFGRGDAGRDLYLVVKGRVKASVLTAEGRELAFAHIDAGSIFGEIAMLDGGVRTADATALTAVEVLTLSQSASDAIIRQSPEFATCIIRFLCARLRETDLQFEGVALHRIEVRLARYLDTLCRQIAPDQDEGEVTIKVPVSQGELALLLGASRPKVNGALAELETGEAIRRSGSTIVCDIDNLRLIGEIDA